MATITNADGTVGNVTYNNQFLMYDTGTLQSRYNLLQNYSTTRKTVVSAGGTSGSNGNGSELDGSELDGSISSKSPNIMGFLSKMEKFFFSPPSDNLWSIHISVDDNSNSSIETLYNNITKVNETWNNHISNTMWKINTSNTKSNQKASNFIKEFDGSHGIFLAQNISFSPIQATINSNVFPMGQLHGGFFNFGNIAQSRPNNRKLNINFLVSNWDIGDILFDPWIAAVSQKGLIEDGNSSIKARITIKEYSSSIPKEYNFDLVIKQMEVRKQYVFRNCVPISRGEISKNYNPSEAGTFKNSIVNFVFDDYEITYFY